jgi:hypothetical protein
LEVKVKVKREVEERGEGIEEEVTVKRRERGNRGRRRKGGRKRHVPTIFSNKVSPFFVSKSNREEGCEREGRGNRGGRREEGGGREKEEC